MLGFIGICFVESFLNLHKSLPPGLIALHSNRTEMLADTVFAWLRAHPLGPLEQEVVLVQSNGMAEWFKMALARQGGVCAAMRVELPGRFLWRTYRQVLGRDNVPFQSPVDKAALTWRLMHQLPELLDTPGFEPIAGFLQGGGDAGRLLQLATRLADLLDQYQVYRPDWLGDWERSLDTLAAPGRPSLAVPDDQRWQPLLWRLVLASLDARERSAIRPHIHQQALQVLLNQEEGAAALVQPVARRVVLFGMAQVPLPVLEILAALAGHTQVLLAVPNPCRFHWADTMDGRELLQFERRRQPLRGGRDLAALPLDAMHAHAHPLLAAWGRQGRDFVRQLDAFDDAQQAQQRFALPRIDLFGEDAEADGGPGVPLLAQVQQRIRDLVPLAEHPAHPADAADRSVVFHTAHSALREVEVLHDQLLQLLANPPGGAPLQPRDIVVMVPDIDTRAAAIRAVFGQYARHDARFIPFDIADLQARQSSPLVGALEWLLRLPQERCRLSALRDLLEVPAVSARFGVAADALPRLSQWMAGSGIRWGLNASQRTGLGLAACGAHNTAEFGLHRMLLGYASSHTGFGGIEPYAEVGGLEAELAGALAQLLHSLEDWRAQVAQPATPAEWAARGRSLLANLFRATDEGEREVLGALDAALAQWLDACAQARFDGAVPLEVAREAWLSMLEEPSLDKRFRAGGVTFCTLLPMRAIPFEAVCLLGMNDGDYPRRTQRSDFDLMALPGQARPGDRSRQSDDRQLMLEALLSARRVLYVSWCGRSVHDNSEQPPSVLVSQLRDYLAAGWQGDVLAERTTEHPLQPFSRRYFEGDANLYTHAREWRTAHGAAMPDAEDAVPFNGAPSGAATSGLPQNHAAALPARAPLTVTQLAAFLRHPVRTFFRERLGVVFDAAAEEGFDDEAFGLQGLEEHGVVRRMVDEVLADLAHQGIGIDNDGMDASSAVDEPVAHAVSLRLAQLQRAGRLPLGGFAERTQQQLQGVLLPLLQAWQALQQCFPHKAPRTLLQSSSTSSVDGALSSTTVQMEDWLESLCHSADANPFAAWLELTPSRLLQKQERKAKDKGAVVRAEMLLPVWVRSLAVAASGVVAPGMLVGRDATLHLPALDAEESREQLAQLLQVWQQGMEGPLPLALRTGLALVQDSGKARQIYEGDAQCEGENADACLARIYPDFEALSADGRLQSLAQAVCAPLGEWALLQVVATPHAAVETGATAPEEAPAT